jgi:hypothetical protein
MNSSLLPVDSFVESKKQTGLFPQMRMLDVCSSFGNTWANLALNHPNEIMVSRLGMLLTMSSDCLTKLPGYAMPPPSWERNSK